MGCITRLQTQFLDWITIPRLTRLASATTIPLVCQQKERPLFVKWKTFSKLWYFYSKNNPGNETQECNLNQVITHHSEEEEIFPPTTPEIAEAQKADVKLKHCFMCNAVLDKGLDVRLVDNNYMVYKEGRMIIPKSLQRHALLWYHHYLQHPGHT
jgi:hypothetical protein